jgi:AraC-like DNA-binding protein
MEEPFALGTRPLDRYPAARTRDLDEMRGVVSQFYGDNRLLLAPGTKGLAAHANHCQLEDVGISYADFGGAIELRFPMFTAAYSMPIAIAGGGSARSQGQTVDLDANQTVIVSEGAPLAVQYGVGFETFTVRLSSAAMRRKLASLFGDTPLAPLIFEPLLDFRRPENGLWRRLVWFLIGEIEQQGDALPHSAVREIEQALLLTFFKANPNNLSHLLEAPIQRGAPWQVRRAEEYIEAHWDQPITVEALALVTNSSARSVFHTFKQSRGYSPMAFVKHVRLRHARGMLLHPSPGISVTDVAFACGFSNLGHFAKDYRAQFGERPSETLKISRGSMRVNPGPPDVSIRP